MVWKENLWLRLLDGNRALKLISDNLAPPWEDPTGQSGGAYPTFLCSPTLPDSSKFRLYVWYHVGASTRHDDFISVLPALSDRRQNVEDGFDSQWDRIKLHLKSV